MTDALGQRFPGAVVDAVEVVRSAVGTNARARIRLSYRRGEGPPSVFVKRPGPLRHRLALSVLGALTTEARLAWTGVTFPLAHPRPYAAGIDGRRLSTVVVMEDIETAGGIPNEATRPLSPDAVRDGLEGLARLHARYWDRQLPPGLGFLRPWRLGRWWALVSVASLARGLRRLAETVPSIAVPGSLDARTLGTQFRRSAVLAASGPPTVLHGDPHPGNTYTLAGGGTGFYDWQLARTGSWSHDVGYFLVGSLAVADRRRHERELLADYLHALRGEGAPAPTSEAAWDRYRATPAFGLATWVHTLSFATLQPAAVCAATIERFATAHADLDTSTSAVAHPA